VVAESALDTAANRQQLAEPQSKWMPRVLATLSAAHAALAQAAPQTLAPLTAGERSHGLPAPSGGSAQRWRLGSSAPRHPQAPRTVDQPLRKPGQRDVAAFQPLGRMPCACEAEAQQALTTLTQGCHATCLPEVAWGAPPRYRPRGRPRQDAQPAQLVSTLTGALASALAARPPRVDQPRGVSLATNARDETLGPPTARFAGSQGPSQAARGCRFLPAPQLLASSRSLTKPARLMALWMGMTGWLLVSAAWA
jgi:hypothetical protein